MCEQGCPNGKEKKEEKKKILFCGIQKRPCIAA